MGIGNGPHDGLSLIKNANIVSMPGEVRVNRETTPINVPDSVSAEAFTVVQSTSVFTVASTTGWYNGMAIQFNSITTSTGFSTGRVYWVGDLSGSTFKIYTNPSRNASSVVTVATGDGSGTLSSYTFGRPVADAVGQSTSLTYKYHFILDENGLAWWIDNTGGTPTNNLVYMGNDTTTSSGGRGINCYKNHLIVMRSGAVDGVGLNSIEGNVDFDSSYTSASAGGWRYGFATPGSYRGDVRPSIVGQDDILYWARSSALASFTEAASSTLDLDNAATYVYNSLVLDIPDEDTVLSLAELGLYLLIGGALGRIYPWDRISTSFNLPIDIPDRKIKHIVSSNAYAYVFAGNRGRIYRTNGASVQLYKKIPDYLAGENEPYFDILDAHISRNQVRFSLTATENDGTAVGGLDGVWAIDLNSDALRLEHTLSHATDGSTPLISEYVLSDNPAGTGILAGWEDDSSNYGIDIGSSNPYSGGETVIDTDMIPIGSFSFTSVPSQVEFALSRPLISGESIEILARKSIDASFVTLGTYSTTSTVSGTLPINFRDFEQLQLRIVLTSTDTSPSFVGLRKIMLSF